LDIRHKIGYAKELGKLIETKSRGENITIEKEEEKPDDTTDVLKALKASISHWL
jgi:non-homologous end joining protein Ku